MKKLLYSSFSFLLLIACLCGCIEDPDPAGGILNARLPSVVMSVEGMNATSITVKVEVSAENGAPVSEYGVCWTTSPDILPTIANDTLIAGRGKGSFTLIIHNLTPKTEYYLRPFATNIVGTGYTEGATKVPTEEGLGMVRTLKVVDVTATTAECGGKIELAGELHIIERGVILKNLITEKDSIIKIAMETDSFYCTITNLVPATPYYVKAYVLDNLNRSYFVSDTDSVKFNTPTGWPELGELDIVPKYESAVLTAEILHIGDAPLEEKGFVFGTTEELDEKVDSLRIEVDPNGNDLGVFEVMVDELKPNEKYYVKAYARNAFGTTETEIKSFYTKLDIPRLLLEFKRFEDGQVILVGKIEDRGQFGVIDVGIGWYKEGDSGNEHVKESIEEEDLSEEDEFTFILKDLIGGVKYYIYAYAENEKEGIGYSEVIEVSTPARFTTKAEFKGDAGLLTTSYTIGNIAYLVGGDAGAQCTDQFYYYNPSNNSWKDLRSFDKKIKQMSACSDSNVGYVMGGTDHERNVFDSFYNYDEGSNSWIEHNEKLPEARFGSISLFIPDLNSIFLIGGTNESDQPTKTIYQYNKTSGSWESLTDFQEEITGGISFEYKNKLYVGFGNTSQLWYTNILSTGFSEWIAVDVPNKIGKVSTAVVYNEKVYMIDKNGNIWEFDLEATANQWKQRGTFPQRMLDFHMFVLQETIYILGQSHNGKLFVTYDPVWDPVVN